VVTRDDLEMASDPPAIAGSEGGETVTAPLDLVVGKLRAVGCDPSATGKDSYESRCPVHRGDRKNLSVKLGDNGAVILHCHHVGDTGRGTCPADSIVQTLGLRIEDLWPKPNGTTSAKKTSGKKSWSDLGKAVHAVGYHLNPTKPSDTWTYLDSHGTPIMAVARYDTADGKTYRPFHRLPSGSWAVGDPPGLLPLYRLPEVIKHNQTVFVVEGEKCALALSRFHAVATTSAHGSESPHLSDWTSLAGKPVVILPDNDPPGEGYAGAVLRILKRLDPRPAWTKVVRLPGLVDGEDVADWIPRVRGDRVGDEGQKAVQDELARLVEAALAVDWNAIDDATSDAARPAGDNPVDEAPIPIPDWPDPPDDVAFQGLAGDVVRLIEPSSEADPVAVLLQFLVGFGNAVGSGLSILADGHHHHANEFVVTVGDTSRARKGTAWRRVKSILAYIDPDWADNRVTHGLSSGEGLIGEIRDKIEGPDKNGVIVVKDTGVDDKRVLVVEQEFGNVLRVLAREGNTLSGLLRLAWDGDTLRTMVKNNPARATNPHASLIGHITAEELDRYLAHVEIFNGLGNRILWACVRRSKRLPFGGSINGGCMVLLGSRLTEAVLHARGIGVMTWTSSGRTLWESEYAALTEDRPGLWGYITARAEAHVLRLSMIVAALDKSMEIADTHVLAALAVWRFCDRSAAHLFGGSVGDGNADAILAALRITPDGMTRTEIRRGLFQDHKSSLEIARALGLLLRYGLVRQEITQTGGRPAERWYAAKS
jgi:hypothetical protein